MTLLIDNEFSTESWELRNTPPIKGEQYEITKVQENSQGRIVKVSAFNGLDRTRSLYHYYVVHEFVRSTDKLRTHVALYTRHLSTARNNLGIFTEPKKV